jgi:hypothetical protein
MRKENLIYAIYCLLIFGITFFISFQILEGNIRLPLRPTIIGKMIEPLTSTEEKEQLLTSLKNFQEVSKISFQECSGKLGFRDYEWTIEKPENTFRIIALGDSYTAGPYVDCNSTWPKQLEKKLNELNLTIKFEVFNMAGPGMEMIGKLDTFKNFGLKYNPDMVILQYLDDDWISPETRTNATELFKMYKNGEYKLQPDIENELKELNASDEAISRTIFEIVLRDYLKSVDTEKEWDKWVEKPLIELVNICKNKNIKLIVITWDAWRGYDQKNKLKKLLSNYNIPFYDFSDNVPDSQPSKIRFSDGHLTSFGYEIVANKTLEAILQNYNFKN